MAKGENPLKNDKEELFAQHYADTLNGTQSAIKSGYGSTYSSSANQAKKLLKNKRIRDRVDYLVFEKAKALGLGKTRRLEEITKIAYGEPKKGLRYQDKLRALELLGKIEDGLEQAFLNIEMERHVADMMMKGIDDDIIEVEDDGFMAAMQDIADSMEDDSFVYTEGIDDKESE